MASKHGPFATFNPWIVWSIVLVVVFWVVSLLIGFVWYPAAASGNSRLGLLQIMCGGLGWVDNSTYAQQPKPPAIVATEVAWTDQTWVKVRSGDPQRGARVARSCVMCHGPTGIGTANYIPNLTGLPPEVIYKELIDYRTGKRNWAFMNAAATGLSDQDTADVAAYFSSCPRQNQLVNIEAGASERDISRLITDGDPIRNVVSCAACHGPQGVKTGAPPLVGQHVQYLSNQLIAFSQGDRSNDMNRQMRLVATRLTPDEIEQLAEYFGGKESKITGR
jgi:cytochrome c553